MYNDAHECEEWQHDGACSAQRQFFALLRDAGEALVDRVSTFWWGWGSAIVGTHAHANRVAHLARQYEVIAPTVAYLRSRVPSVVAIWDDHDFGENDAGGDLPYKQHAKMLFKRAWRPQRASNESQPEIMN